MTNRHSHQEGYPPPTDPANHHRWHTLPPHGNESHPTLSKTVSPFGPGGSEGGCKRLTPNVSQIEHNYPDYVVSSHQMQPSPLERWTLVPCCLSSEKKRIVAARYDATIEEGRGYVNVSVRTLRTDEEMASRHGHDKTAPLLRVKMAPAATD